MSESLLATLAQRQCHRSCSRHGRRGSAGGGARPDRLQEVRCRLVARVMGRETQTVGKPAGVEFKGMGVLDQTMVEAIQTLPLYTRFTHSTQVLSQQSKYERHRQACSSSSCEGSWSARARIHSGVRNRQRLEPASTRTGLMCVTPIGIIPTERQWRQLLVSAS